MHFTLTSILSALLIAPAIAMPAADPAGLKKRCVVNAKYRDDWNDHGLHRFRTVFSVEGTEAGDYCTYWSGATGSNIQCAWDAAVDGGSWRVDASYAYGSEGIYWSDLGNTRYGWQVNSGCTTG